MIAHDHHNCKPKTMLHELLKGDQEPFHLSKYISHKRSMLRKQTDPKSTLLLPVKRRTTSGNNLCRHAACFFTLHSTSPDDVTKSPFTELPSPAINKSPSNSPNGAVFLDIPSRIASVLLEAALRIQKPKPRSSHAGFGLFGSFLKRLKSKSKKHDLKSTLEQSIHTIPSSSTCVGSERKNKSGLSSVGWTESYREDTKSLEFEEAPSTSCCGSDDDTANGDFDFPETRFCMSPFVFSLPRSTSPCGAGTPELCSPARSPGRLVIQENENSRNENNEEKEQCSPVSVLDPPLDVEDDEDETEEEDDDDDDYDLESSYANVQRAKQQLLQRLRRFERLADLDPIELERKLMLESSDDEVERDETLSANHSTYEVLSLDRPSNILQHSHSIDHCSKRLVVIEEKCEIICSRLDSKREVEGLNTIDMMMELDFKRERGEWTEFREQVEETAEELEVSIFHLLMEELI